MQPDVADQQPGAAYGEGVDAAPGEFTARRSLALSTPKQAPPLPPLETLTNLDSSGLRKLLGAPVFTRRDDPAQLWQYRGDRCTLDIFLYQPIGGGDYRVDFFAARASGSAAVSTAACFHSVIAGGDRKAG